MKLHCILLLCLYATLASCSIQKIATFDGANGTSFQWRFLGDPVMGGASTGSFTVDSSLKVGVLNGTVALIPFLKAPGVIQAHSAGHVADISEYLNGSLQMRVRSTIPYKSFKIGFSAPDIPHKKSYQAGSFKADVKIEGSGWQTVSVPFSSFSWDWSTYTGECDSVDPDGTTHQCCDANHPDVCPNAKFLSSIDGLQVWAEGAVGNIHLEIESFSVTMESTAEVVMLPEAEAVTDRPPANFDSCSGPVQPNLRYNISARMASNPYVPVANESMASGVCCDSRFKPFAEPQFLFEASDIQLFSSLDSSGVTTFFDSVCGLPVFKAPIGRTMEDFKADTTEHGWPSFRTEEIVAENIVTDKSTAFVTSKCGTHLGSFLPDSKGDRWCIDLSCISGNPKK